MEPLSILLIIQFLCVFVIDYSGFIDDGLTPLVRKLTGSKVGSIGKPLSCSLCSSLWIGIIYIIVAGLPFWNYIWIVALLSILTPVTLIAINFVKDLLFKAFEVLYKVFGMD